MIKRVIFAALFVAAALSVSLNGQEVGWEIKRHSTELKALEQEVSVFINKGWAPLGLTYDESELYILYVHSPDLEIKAWLIQWYSSAEEMKQKVSATIKSGYVPTGITYFGEKFYVLYIQAKTEVRSWLLVPSATDLKSVQAAIQPELDKGYVPAGITLLGMQYWTLLIETPGSAVKKWRLESYDVGQHGKEINRNIGEGYLPWGIEYRGNRIDILYVGF